MGYGLEDAIKLEYYIDQTTYDVGQVSLFHLEAIQIDYFAKDSNLLINSSSLSSV